MYFQGCLLGEMTTGTIVQDIRPAQGVVCGSSVSLGGRIGFIRQGGPYPHQSPSSSVMATAADTANTSSSPFAGFPTLPHGLSMDNTYGAALLGTFLALMCVFLPSLLWRYSADVLTSECMACCYTRCTTTSASIPETPSGSSFM